MIELLPHALAAAILVDFRVGPGRVEACWLCACTVAASDNEIGEYREVRAILGKTLMATPQRAEASRQAHIISGSPDVEFARDQGVNWFLQQVKRL